MIVIPYTILPGKPKPVHLPFARIKLNYKKTHKMTPVPVTALIDSGADVCFCNDMIGTWLGIKFKKDGSEKQFRTANKTKFNAIPFTVTLIAYGKTYDCKFYFTDVLPRHTPIILGQVGFFDHFKITFDYSKNEITLI
ncbi:hypothetical protein A3A93_02995 [Candidatus Roizmanbacteria bacterium RIFCSPLOWO2_01_FULL_38_12]|uniref:Peptidase A2 domain-containing protein n=1 Tax=Candidatus Roizmanbacteria bacterium RIFCSPLOWO2_01_FULL_38_12 TaxID=1802061 RepID=A0A1F7IXR4_9BACT|nr:MAG: hypothetical protein A3F59_02120 [Candidatus Roizmanbacteria bacterium RIFCSPHIGHO2_12_FULL_38_13]OGK48172.1 MAG: hypothetical protein A3A93_02995 [Candidatus Roizmanbacteria bacterium RIFCSPLOWO2_01_FULL_38_12]